MEVKRAKVIMLPTENKTNIVFNKNTNALLYGNFVILSEYKYQHLYITTDDEIKEGDWYIDDVNDIRESLTSDKDYWEARQDYRKIIATTDKSLFTLAQCKVREEGQVKYILPKPSQAFIEKYCKVGGIDEVLVEYENDINDLSLPINKIPKVDSHNTITIHPIKDSWNRAEYNQIARDAFKAGMAYESLCRRGFKSEAINENTWIKENL